MAGKAKKSASKETHQTIQDQTAAFLKAGGKIQEVATGVTGQKYVTGRRQIVLGKSSTNSSS